MNLALTEDQIMIRDAAESFLADVSASAQVRAALESDIGFDPQVWQRIGAELGWCGVAIAEKHGGLGLGPAALALIQEQAGRHLLCSPFFATVCLGATLLQEVSSDAAQSRYLPELAEGRRRLAVALPSDVSGYISSAKNLRATRKGSEWILDGRVSQMVDGASADTLLVLAHVEKDVLGLFSVPRSAAGLHVTALNTWDRTRRFADAEFKSVTAEMRCDEPSRLSNGLTRSSALISLYIAAEQLGSAHQCMDLTVAYTATRKQFGRVIASFQAVKHRCAEMMVKIEALRSGVQGAAVRAGENGPVEILNMECMMARALAGDALFFCAGEAIQLHGGVGFTWEYDPQLYFKRAQASSHWFGNSDDLRESIAKGLLDAPPALAA